jgi:hypothetical protein
MVLRKTARHRPHDGYARANQLSRHEACILWEWRGLKDLESNDAFKNKHHTKNIKVNFRTLKQFQSERGLLECGQRTRLGADPELVERFFPGDTMPDR